MVTTVEIRCPKQGRLFAKVSRPKIVDGNLIEFACRDCRRALDAALVLHRYDVTGQLIETEVTPK